MTRFRKMSVVAILILSVVLGSLFLTSCGNREKWDIQTDFLIIGGGIAGLSAAIEAADIGIRDILILEQLGFTGGAAFISAGILGGWDTQVSRAQGINVDPVDIFNEHMREKKFLLDPRLTMQTVNESSGMIDWLIGLGVEFEPQVGTREGYGTLNAIHLVKDEGVGMRAPFEEAIESRREITTMLHTRAVELVERDGVVVGAVAVQDGKTLRIGAKAVLLATGGYTSNHELITMAHPANRVFQAGRLPGANGDGLIMATRLGAATQGLDQIQVYMSHYDNARSSLPWIFNIFVGWNGSRFMDEKRTGQTWNDDNRLDTIMRLGLDGQDHFWAINDHAAMTMFGIAGLDMNSERVVVGNTIEELAAATGINASGLRATVNRWNTMVRNGADTDFGRTSMLLPITTGPFYAVRTILSASVSHGGIVKNELSEVLRFDGSKIPGLYAAGEVAVVTNSNGYTINNAIIFGRIAARSASDFIRR